MPGSPGELGLSHTVETAEIEPKARLTRFRPGAAAPRAGVVGLNLVRP